MTVDDLINELVKLQSINRGTVPVVIDSEWGWIGIGDVRLVQSQDTYRVVLRPYHVTVS